MHRGDIEVESNADSEKGPTGTTFTVILPRMQTNGF
jgi:signal transduction histidine kinase